METAVYESFYHYNRNYGCRVHEVTWNGFQTLVVENERVRVSILVEKGTDIVELLYKPMDIDFMWKSPLEVDAETYRNPITRSMDAGNFLDAYEGGWQELLPTITSPTNYQDMGLGFHGEMIFLPWKYSILEDSPYEVKIRFQVRMKRAPLFVTKDLTLRSGKSVLEFEETIRNEADEEFKFMWGHHPTYGVPFLDGNCVIDVPAGVTGQVYQSDFSGNCIFDLNKEFTWPLIEDKQGRTVDLSQVMTPDKKIAYNIYLKNLQEGWYGITNLKKKVGIGFRWDVNIFKYLLMWSVYRGYYHFPFYGRTYNLALELYSAIPDNLDEVIRLHRELSLMPGEELKTRFFTTIYESGQRIQGFDDEYQPISRKS